MAIVFVHGVANRTDTPKYAERWRRLEVFLRRYVAPAISDQPANVHISAAYWGDLGAQFAWDRASRPRTPLLGMGAGPTDSSQQQATMIASSLESLRGLPAGQAPQQPVAGLLIPAGPSVPVAGSTRLRLADLTPDQLSDVAAILIRGTGQNADQETLALVAADAVAHDPATQPILSGCSDYPAEITALASLIDARYRQEQANAGALLVSQGGADWLSKFQDRLTETWGRIDSAPGYAVSRALVEARKPLNDLVTLFLGDVLTYIGHRGSAQTPGAIPTRVLQALKEASQAKLDAGEPLVVLTHSMGGQILYDLVTCFIPQDPALQDLRIDFWCATASQVGLFEELKLFLADHSAYGKSFGNQVPFPDRHHLGGWWNVWDHNDVLSFTAKEIMAGIDDQSYDSGVSVVEAHSSYLEQPSFFRAFAGKLAAARLQNWWR